MSSIAISYTDKSTQKASHDFFILDKGMSLHRIKAENGVECELMSNVDKGIIQLSMCFEGEMKFWFGPSYSMDLTANQVMTLYNPSMDLPHRIDVKGKMSVVVLFISVQQLHELFVKESEELHFLRGDSALQKFYAKDEMKAGLSMCVNQILTAQFSAQSEKLFMKGKAFEILSHYFHKPEGGGDLYDSCPFLKDYDNVKKIKQAKEIILDRMTEPPTIKALASEVEMSEYQLKLGFKNIYGATIYGYLTDYKMNQGMAMLDSGDYKVKDAAYALGYVNPSHFIAAFKKKFGITPKKYLMQ